MSSKAINIFRSLVPAPDGTAIGNLRHVLGAFADEPDDKMVIQASGNVYGANEPGVQVRGERGATFTGLTYGDLRELLRLLDGQ
jgi:hypothetical protein